MNQELQPISAFELTPQNPLLVAEMAEAFRTPDNLFKRASTASIVRGGLALALIG